MSFLNEGQGHRIILFTNEVIARVEQRPLFEFVSIHKPARKTIQLRTSSMRTGGLSRAEGAIIGDGPLTLGGTDMRDLTHHGMP